MWVIQAKYHQIPITISIVYCENHNYLTILITCKIITVLQHMAEYESRSLSVIATVTGQTNSLCGLHWSHGNLTPYALLEETCQNLE